MTLNAARPVQAMPAQPIDFIIRRSIVNPQEVNYAVAAEILLALGESASAS
jgi:hypothetical protein